MKRVVFCMMTLILFSFPVLGNAGFSSPFPSTVEGLDIPNAHEIGLEGDARVLRGMAPRNDADFQALLNLKVQDILIFKNQTHTEVDEELIALREAGYPDGRVHHIPFRWKNVESFESGCTQALAGLKILRDASRFGRSVFFHCTVGEDRTGFLAGLYRQIMEGKSAQEAFYYEMCENGYGGGNPRKPYAKVVEPIRQELTPLYLKMSLLIKRGAVSMDSLDSGACSQEPSMEEVAAFYPVKKFRCRTSSRYPKRSSSTH